MLLFLLLLLLFSILRINFSGTVLDKTSGQPILPSKCKLQGSINGVSTDFDGKFQLPNAKKGAKIVFSFIGYKTQLTMMLKNQ
jgi:iron complex outermembrane receptor protein